MSLKRTLFLILILLFGTTAWTSPTVIDTKRRNAIYRESIRTIVQYYAKDGDKRTVWQIKPFMDSAYRVSYMVEGFPFADPLMNVDCFVSYGAHEVGLKRNVVCFNLPGDKFFSSRGVKYFSIDFGWTGMNSGNLAWDYTIAHCLQNNLPFPRWIRQCTNKKALQFMRKNVHIPKNLKLKWIDPEIAHRYKELWEEQRHHSSRSDFRQRNVVLYSENTDNDLDSMLLYRVLVEIDRACRGWSYQTWDKKLYKRLNKVRTKILEE